MKKLLIACSLLLLLSFTVAAQDERLRDAPKSFRTFYASFIRAVERSDKKAVASMTTFPFTWRLDAGDEGRYTRTQFIRNFKRLFGDDPRDALPGDDPSYGREGRKYYISTEDASHFGFLKTGRTYKFVSYIVEP